MSEEKKIRVEFWSGGYPGGNFYYKSKEDRAEVERLKQEYRDKAIACMNETNADHVLYAIQYVGMLKRISFYEPQPLTDEEFNLRFAYQGKRMIYAVHNPASGADKNNDGENNVNGKEDGDASGSLNDEEKPQEEQAKETKNDSFWQIPEDNKDDASREAASEQATPAEEEKTETPAAASDRPAKKPSKKKGS